MIKNNKGFSFAEIMISISLLGIVSVAIMNLTKNESSQTLRASQDQYIGSVHQIVSQALSSVSTCNQIFGTNPTTASFSTLNLPSKSTVEILTPNIDVPSPSGSGIEEFRVDVSLIFKRKLSSTKSQTLIRRTKASIQYTNGAYVGCLDNETSSIRNVFRQSCEMINGSFVLDSIGSENCDFSNIGSSSNFSKAIQKTACESIFGGIFNDATQKCSRLDVGASTMTASNIEANRIQLKGSKWRNTFSQTCSTSNSFIRDISTSGTVNCITITTCTKGDDC